MPCVSLSSALRQKRWTREINESVSLSERPIAVTVARQRDSVLHAVYFSIGKNNRVINHISCPESDPRILNLSRYRIHDLTAVEISNLATLNAVLYLLKVADGLRVSLQDGDMRERYTNGGGSSRYGFAVSHASWLPRLGEPPTISTNQGGGPRWTSIRARTRTCRHSSPWQ